MAIASRFLQAHMLAVVVGSTVSLVVAQAPTSTPPVSGSQPPATVPSAAPAMPINDGSDGKWDVANPPSNGSMGGWGWKEVKLDTDEGTWISLDVSPDGKTIVFDLLGDIYTMPILGSADGSQVKCIAAGRQWDMQPRFSPDGKSIAFVSDRTGEGGKGGDNIWVMKTDGSQPRQITRETFRLLTQPIWTPDGQSIIARKHFTSRRSLGAGEMWLYHFSAKTDGQPLTTKQSEQKDTGEPAISADGRYLYYSFDASAGGGFEYDKDSNAGIYAIDRLDLQTQRSERVVAGPGGACRPVPSPDGKSLAFVRRVRYQTTLFVMDLASGQTRQVFSALERDNQETWAVHGVYPAMSWMPDGKSMVLWAGGKIRRVDMTTGQADIIPFRVQDTRQIAEAVRFPVAVAPAGQATFDVKMIRDAVVSPKGDRIVFQALGHIWTATFAAGAVGTPQRVTTKNDSFEFFPTWSRDGQKLAFVRWTDERLGQIVVLEGSKESLVTDTPGHYSDLAFDPDGSALAFVKGGGGYLTSPLWGRDQGVYVAKAVSGGWSAQRVSSRGGNPQFGADPSRVLVTLRDGGSDSDSVSLLSVPVQGTNPQEGERTLYRSSWATEWRISPDGKWLVFAERYKLYVTPFIDAGRPLEIGPGARNVPVIKLTDDAGYGVHWSGDSSGIFWSLGADLFSKSVSEAMVASQFSVRESGAGTEVSEPKKAEIAVSRINLQGNWDKPVRADGSESVIAITNVKILTMEDAKASGAWTPDHRGMEVINDGVVIVSGNRISAVGPKATTSVPAGATMIDGKGGTLMPGIIDVHAHGAHGSGGITPQRNWISHANLAFGVTTIHDPSNDTEMIFAASEMQKAGMIMSPRVYSTGTILYGAQGAYRAEIESLEDAMFHLKRMKAVGAFSVKSYNQPRRDQRQMVMEAARRVGMMVVPEGGALYQHNMTMVVDGHTSVEHTVPVENIYKDVTTLWGASKTGYTPTLGVAYGGMGGENYWYARTKVWENDHLMNFVPRFVVDPRSRRRTDAPDEEWNHIKESRVAKMVLDAKQAAVIAQDTKGGGPTLGAHGQLAGLAAHWELWMFVQGGMTPHEALRAGTIDGAWYVGLDGDLGSIKAGKLADLVIFSKDPSTDIRNTDSIVMVMQNGRMYDARSLAQLAPVQAPAPKQFFVNLQKGSGTPLALELIMQQAARNGGTCEACGRAH